MQEARSDQDAGDYQEMIVTILGATTMGVDLINFAQHKTQT